ncbi:MAG: hypothetical protein NVSMB23_26240 [Myxococcales bacterium]
MRRIAFLVVLALAACSKKPAQAPAAEAAGIDTAAGRALTLALMKPDADLPIDQRIARLQQSALKLDKSDAWVALGEAWIRKARDTARPFFYANAGASADLALALEPTSKLALDLKALVLMNDHRFEEARVLASGIVARSPGDPVAWGTLSDALLELGRTAEAVEAAQRMMDLKPNLPSYSRAAHLQWLHGDLPAAKESVRLAIDAGSDGKDKEPQAWVTVQAGMIFWNEGDAPGAEAGFDLALQSLPDFPPALVGKARVLLGRGDGKGAAALLERAYQAIPLVETGWLLGDAREAAGDAAGAGQVWADIERRGRTSDPRTLALFWATQDREHEAALKLALDERKVRDDEYTEDVAAWALYRAGRFDEARAASDKALRLGTRDARLWFHAGVIRIAGGDAAGGRALVRKALDLNPHFDRKGEAEARQLLTAGLAAKGR